MAKTTRTKTATQAEDGSMPSTVATAPDNIGEHRSRQAELARVELTHCDPLHEAPIATVLARLAVSCSDDAKRGPVGLALSLATQARQLAEIAAENPIDVRAGFLGDAIVRHLEVLEEVLARIAPHPLDLGAEANQ